jgi:hypothetical protein
VQSEAIMLLQLSCGAMMREAIREVIRCNQRPSCCSN